MATITLAAADTGNEAANQGTADADVINGNALANTLNGNAGNDTIFGGAGADLVNGGTGVDLLIGGDGDDTYVVDDGADQIIEGAPAGPDVADTVRASVSYALGQGVQVEIMETTNAAGTGAINLTGNELTQTTITGNAGANVLDGGVDTNADGLVGLGGNDTYIVRQGDTATETANNGFDTVLITTPSATFTTFTTAANNEIEVVQMAVASATNAFDIVGNEVSQTLVGNNGVNRLTDNGAGLGTGGGSDTLIGLGGNDTYDLNRRSATTGNALGSIVEAAGGGTDIANVNGNFTVGAQEIEIVNQLDTTGTIAAGTQRTITGSAINQSLNGNTGDDILIGGGGTDTLAGGAGGDFYTVDSLDDVVIEAGGAGTDRVTVLLSGAGAGYYVGASAAAGGREIEAIIASGTTLGNATNQGDGTTNLNAVNTTNAGVGVANPTYLVGNQTAAQVLVGDAGSNILNGYANGGIEGAALAGFDTLIGLQGDDIYRVYQQSGAAATSDVVVEDRDGGGDIIYTSADFSLVTNDTYAAALNLTVAANGFAFVGATYITGAQQIEVLSASTQSANLGGAGINLTGNAYGNIIIGDYGNNNIVGGGTTAGGVDVLYGLLGNDNYTVDSVQTFVNENAGEGTDSVTVTVSGFTLNAGSSVETITLATAGASSVVGNEQNQTINGNAQDNTLNGGGGADILVGLAGNDVYQVDGQEDVVTEAAGAGNGFDTVFASTNYDLRANTAVEVLSAANQASTTGLTLTGNNLVNTLVGTSGDDVLNGDNDTLTAGVMTGTAAGDRLVGLGGNDSYRVYSQNDVVIEAVGGGTNDVVFFSSGAAAGTYRLHAGQEVETLSAANQAQTGALATMTLRGNERANVIIGNDGDNTLDGGAGNDLLIGRSGNDDYQFTTALDAATNVDTLVGFGAGDRIVLDSTIFTGGIGGSVDITEFRTIGSGTQDADDYILYNQTTGEIFFDVDGSGIQQAVLFAKVDPGLALGYTDFFVQAINPGAPPAVPAASNVGV